MKKRIAASALGMLLALGACQRERTQTADEPAAGTPEAAPAAEATAQPEAAGSEVAEADTAGMAGTSSPDTSGRAPQEVVQDTAFVGTTEPIARRRSAPPVATLREVRAAAHAGYDRVVFEFAAGPLPGYHIEYAEGTVHQCGSGDEVSVASAATLVVGLEPARAHDDQGNVTISERRRVLALPVVRELMIICDFEAQVEWVAGLAGRKPYRVMELSGPPRLVVDLGY
jgi:hypothetical protein